jgi:outer membrane protein OmpA-like peptidoglycan-associated protein
VDRPSAEFDPAVESFYATPTSGTPAESGVRFEAILDDFAGGDATLTPAHRKELDRVAAKVVAAAKHQKVKVLVGGFGDKMDRDPQKASQLRAEAVVAYLKQAGVTTEIWPTWFGSSWARAPLSMKEGRNRRVQIKVNYPRK